MDKVTADYSITVRVPGVGRCEYRVTALSITGAMTIAELRASMTYEVPLNQIKSIDIKKVDQ